MNYAKFFAGFFLPTKNSYFENLQLLISKVNLFQLYWKSKKKRKNEKGRNESPIFRYSFFTSSTYKFLSFFFVFLNITFVHALL